MAVKKHVYFRVKEEVYESNKKITCLCGKKVSRENAIDDINAVNCIYRISKKIAFPEDCMIVKTLCKKCLERI
jgi:hypothetical protein